MTGAASADVPALRPQLAGAKRVVVKVGSSSLTTLPGGLDAARLSALVDVLGAVRAHGREVVLVSSGAIAAGLAPLGIVGPTPMFRWALLLSLITSRSVVGQPGARPSRLGATMGS